MSEESWILSEELGGADKLEAVIARLYDRLFTDMMIGFFFAGKDKAELIRSQITYVEAHLGARGMSYEGPSIRKAHAHLPILVGHFDRRHQILREVLEEFSVPEHVATAWLELDASLRDFVVGMGGKARDQILRDQ